MKDWQKLLIAIVIIFLVVMGIAKWSDWSNQKAVEKNAKKWTESITNNK